MSVLQNQFHYKKPLWRRKVEQMLELYPIYKQALSQHCESLLVPPLRERVDGGSKESTTEQIVMRRAAKQRIVDQIEGALSVLTAEEKEVIELTYWPVKMSVKGVCNQLTISERKYYRLKKAGISKMAFALLLK
ncbi:phage transcriptional activator, RinA family [Seinonella peptonophila]|uniref:Phage transcriptional activator, RinA family n=1 Tax=Seinonella peptonophila TaxID=112248 RepID=A0A1M5BJ38_9BACL|nr:DUF1492 domain-containing protein [Seinonella peptonophila]SHF42475.1 phage transcriptional activator, RinA family [Seinonella peptonophila]